MNNKIKFLKILILPIFLVFLFVLNIENNLILNAFSDQNQSAQVVKSTKTQTRYNISYSKEFPGTFNFDYAYEKLDSKSKEAFFDLPIIPFDDEIARKELGDLNADFGPIRDAWNYPVKENAFMKKEASKKQSFLDSLKTNKAIAYDEDTANPGVYNCRANTSVTGYFKAYFEDVALNTNIGFDDPVYGEGRREEACQVLEDMSELLMMDTTTVTPDILFMRSDVLLPPGALAGASSYFGYYTVGQDNGALHRHIISRQDQTPIQGYFDAFIITNFNGVNWSVDSTLNSNTYDFYTVIWHEMMHTLGFKALLPAVIQETGVEQIHGTFDYHTHKDESLQNRFINAITNLLNVPVGAPSPWFVTNQVVYRGIKNIVGATPDGIRPVYSPASWQQGSSLSHFDMNRAPGETYVMHPSIGTNTEREIHEHEKEVLCHLGYMVEGVEGCEVTTPFAGNDLFDTNYPAICVDFSLNDYSFSGGVLSVNSFDVLNSQPGDQIVFRADIGCGGVASSSFLNAKSFYYYSSGQGERLIRYTVKDSISNRISMPAYILNSGAELCQNTDPENFICNGDFELGELQNPSNIFYGEVTGICPSNIYPWCNFDPSIDIYDRALNFINPWTGNTVNPDTHNGFPNNRYLGGICASGEGISSSGDIAYCENAFVKTKTNLLPGNYSLSFMAIASHLTAGNNPKVKIYVTNTEPLQINGSYSQLPQDLVFESNLSSSGVPAIQSDWDQYFININIPNNGVSYKYLIFEFSYETPNGIPPYSGVGRYYMDDVRLEAASNASVSGNVYHDLNQNGSQQSVSEPGLPGLQIGLFQSGNNTPIQTTLTQDLPNLGKYEFTSLPDSTYYTALISENIYPQITEPGVGTDPFPAYNHMNVANVSGGQTVQNLNFGIILEGDEPPVNTNGKVDIKVTKELVDSSLSLFDRYITWRIDVKNIGDSLATNVQVKEIIPPGLIYHNHQTPNTNSYNENVHMLYIPSLNPNQETHLFITMKVPNSSKICGTRTNTALLHALDQLDSNQNNNEGSATIKLQRCRSIVRPEIQVE
jgi:uncharacterized repeat protein (TIGR01451 family)